MQPKSEGCSCRSALTGRRSSPPPRRRRSRSWSAPPPASATTMGFTATARCHSGRRRNRCAGRHLGDVHRCSGRRFVFRPLGRTARRPGERRVAHFLNLWRIQLASPGCELEIVAIEFKDRAHGTCTVRRRSPCDKAAMLAPVGGPVLSALGTGARWARGMGRGRLMQAGRDGADAAFLCLGRPPLRTDIEGLPLRGYLRHRSFLAHLASATYEPEYRRLFLRELRPGATVVDAGRTSGHTRCSHAARLDQPAGSSRSRRIPTTCARSSRTSVAPGA